MTPITPKENIGYVAKSMVVVICPTCGQKRWANIAGGGRAKRKRTARTTCCGTLVTY